MRILWRAQRWSAFLCCGLLAVLLSPEWAWSLTIAEVLKNPSAFDQQTITVTGQVANVVTRYGEAVSTTFDLLGAKGEALAILVSGVPQCKQGDICKVSGLFVAKRNLLLPQTIKRIAERPFESAGVLFHQRREGGSAARGKTPRGMYIPE